MHKRVADTPKRRQIAAALQPGVVTVTTARPPHETAKGIVNRDDRIPVVEPASADFGKIAVAAKTVLKAGRAGDAVLDQRLTAVVPFLDQRIPHR